MARQKKTKNKTPQPHLEVLCGSKAPFRSGSYVRDAYCTYRDARACQTARRLPRPTAREAQFGDSATGVAAALDASSPILSFGMAAPVQHAGLYEPAPGAWWALPSACTLSRMSQHCSLTRCGLTHRRARPARGGGGARGGGDGRGGVGARHGYDRAAAAQSQDGHDFAAGCGAGGHYRGAVARGGAEEALGHLHRLALLLGVFRAGAHAPGRAAANHRVGGHDRLGGQVPRRARRGFKPRRRPCALEQLHLRVRRDRP